MHKMYRRKRYKGYFYTIAILRRKRPHSRIPALYEKARPRERWKRYGAGRHFPYPAAE
jgi:hypothetical protein